MNSPPTETSVVPYHQRTERPERVGEVHLSKSRRQIIAAFKAEGRLLSTTDMEYAAEQLGTTVKQIKEWSKDPSVNALAMQFFQPRAFETLVRKWPTLEECMDEKKSWAFKLAAQISTLLPVGGVSFQQNVAIDARAAGMGDNHTQFARNFWIRVKESRTSNVIEAESEDVGDQD